VQAGILDALKVTGWEAYHAWISAKSTAGFPDIVALRPPRGLAIECKGPGKRPTPAQLRWLEMFAAVPGFEAHVADPDTYDAILKRITARA
jgi:Holliday junction resolvase